MLDLLHGSAVVLPLLVATGEILVRLLPLLSDRVNARKVLLINAKNKQS